MNRAYIPLTAYLRLIARAMTQTLAVLVDHRPALATLQWRKLERSWDNVFRSPCLIGVNWWVSNNAYFIEFVYWIVEQWLMTELMEWFLSQIIYFPFWRVADSHIVLLTVFLDGFGTTGACKQFFFVSVFFVKMFFTLFVVVFVRFLLSYYN